MAISTMSESQKQMLDKLRRGLEMNPQVLLPEEKGRFYRALDALEDPQEPEEVTVMQDQAALQVLLTSLRMLVIRLGKDHGLYRDLIDALRSIAPEMAGEAERIAEQDEQTRQRELQQSIADAQKRFDDTFPWIAEASVFSGDTEEKTSGEEERKPFVAYVFEQLLSAVDRVELDLYTKKKQEDTLTHEEVMESRERFYKRAETRVEEEFQKEKPDEVFTRRMNAVSEILKMGWNPDDMEMVDTFIGILDHIPSKKKIREQGEAVLAELLTTKVDSWEQRQILMDQMSSYCEQAGRELYPDGNADPAFQEAVAKLVNFANKVIRKEEYPDDPQFKAPDAKPDEKEIAKVTRSAVDHVLGAQDYEGLERKRSQSLSRKATLPKKQITTEGEDAGPVICDLNIRDDSEEMTLPERGRGHLILDLSAGIRRKEGYLDAATGEYYFAEELEKLPHGIYFAEENTLFRITSLSQLDDLLEHIPFDAKTGKVNSADRIRKSAKQFFVDRPLEIAYRDPEEREQVLASVIRAQEMLLNSEGEKYGINDLRKTIRKYQVEKQKGEDPQQITQTEDELILQLRQYMEAVPERIGRTSRKNLEYACDLLCGLQRERNFRKKNRQYEEEASKKENSREDEMNACMRIQSMLGNNRSGLEAMFRSVEMIGGDPAYADKAFMRMRKAMLECASLDEQKYSIREMNNAYQELHRSAVAFATEHGWNSMDALQKAGSEKEKQMISTVQKMIRTGKNMSVNLLEISGRVRDKTSPLQTMMYRILEEYEEEVAQKEHKKKEKEKIEQRNRVPEVKEKKIPDPVLRKK
ncbi:MAG: hypothetical protein J6M27_11680 [Lachnospiraceae bacterium]|nr:hypothetical protein [Lachnospiraceae bacterium]